MPEAAFAIVGMLVPVLLFAGIVGLAIAGSQKMARRMREAWSASAQRLGLGVDLSRSYRPKIYGQRDGFGVNVDVYTTGSGKNKSTWTRFRVASTGPAAALNLGPENFFSSMGVSLTSRVDHLIGDRAFDDAAIIDGNEAVALAVLHHGFRHPFAAAMHEGVRLKAGTFIVRRSGVVRDAHRLTYEVERLLALAKSANVGDVAGRIARNALVDPEPGVRQRCFEFAVARYPNHEATRRMLEEGRRSPWVDMRIRVATRLGTNGLPTLEPIVVDPSVSPPWRAEALRRVAGLGSPRTAELALTVVETGFGSLLDAGLDVAMQLRLPAFAPHIRARLVRHEAHDVPRAIRALAATGDVSDEALLIGGLGNDDEAIVIAAIEALGVLGTIGAVEKLLKLSKGVFRDRDIKRAARGAVDAIQGRAGGGGHGGLAVAAEAPVGGEVAMAVEVEAAQSVTDAEVAEATLGVRR